MPTLREIEHQGFEFGDRWSTAFKYDDSIFYRKEANKLQGDIGGIPQSAKAVDIVALHDRGMLLFLEAKDFRGHRIANKTRLNGEVAIETAVKVRDTVAALIGASRMAVDEFAASALAAALQPGNHVTMVLWLEDDTFRDADHAKRKLNALNGVLKSKLTWLNVKTLVLSTSVPNLLPDLRVTNLAGAGQPNAPQTNPTQTA